MGLIPRCSLAAAPGARCVVVPDLLGELEALLTPGVVPRAVDLLPQHAELMNKLIAKYGSFGRARMRLGLRFDVERYRHASDVIRTLRRLSSEGERVTPRRLRELGEA